jgi:hypothetical protein
MSINVHNCTILHGILCLPQQSARDTVTYDKGVCVCKLPSVRQRCNMASVCVCTEYEVFGSSMPQAHANHHPRTITQRDIREKNKESSDVTEKERG